MTFADYMESGIDSIEDYFGAKEALQKEMSLADLHIPEGTRIGSFVNPPRLTATIAATIASKE